MSMLEKWVEKTSDDFKKDMEDFKLRLDKKLTGANLNHKDFVIQYQDLIDDLREMMKPRPSLDKLVAMVKKPGAQDAEDQIVKYLVGEGYVTWLGEEIKPPELKDLEKNYLKVLTDIQRIFLEVGFNRKFQLSLSGHPDEVAAKIKQWCTKSGTLGDYLGGAAGRATAGAIASAAGSVVKLGEEFITVTESFFAVSTRKFFEAEMSKMVLDKPDNF